MLAYLPTGPATDCFVALGRRPEATVEAVRAEFGFFCAALHANAPKLESHFAGLGVPLETIWFDWALTLFAKPFPVHLAAVVWDAMFLEQDEGDRLRRL